MAAYRCVGGACWPPAHGVCDPGGGGGGPGGTGHAPGDGHQGVGRKLPGGQPGGGGIAPGGGNPPAGGLGNSAEASCGDGPSWSVSGSGTSRVDSEGVIDVAICHGGKGIRRASGRRRLSPGGAAWLPLGSGPSVELWLTPKSPAARMRSAFDKLQSYSFLIGDGSTFASLSNGACEPSGLAAVSASRRSCLGRCLPARRDRSAVTSGPARPLESSWPPWSCKGENATPRWTSEDSQGGRANARRSLLGGSCLGNLSPRSRTYQSPTMLEDDPKFGDTHRNSAGGDDGSAVHAGVELVFPPLHV
jgi:hypothetical protein